MRLTFYGAAQEVTGSCCLLEHGDSSILIDCGLFQGHPRNEEDKNLEPFPFDPATLDAVLLTHSHIDHSGRLPMLVNAGFTGRIFTHRASRDLCRIMLKDAEFIHEKNAEWENKKRERKGLPLVSPLYTVDDAKHCMKFFKGTEYGKTFRLAEGIRVKLHDAGHILGASIIELIVRFKSGDRTIIFSGDLGKKHSLLLHEPENILAADLVIMESTYGDRLHRSEQDTLDEFQDILRTAHHQKGNVLIPSFAVGRTQELLYLFKQHYEEWELNNWHIFLDSPMAIEATSVYSRHQALHNKAAAKLWRQNDPEGSLPNLHFTRTANQSMNLNKVRSGAIIIAGSGMCNGGRIRHHFKHNIWRSNCHIVMVGFQARNTPGRALVDGAQYIRLWGETVKVEATIHTVGGLSAHADQADLVRWFTRIENQPQLILVHGESEAIHALSEQVRLASNRTEVTIAKQGKTLNFDNL